MNHRTLMSEFTTEELEEALGDDIDAAIVPLGAFEQHGPHLPLSVDSDIGTELAERIAARVSQAVATPTVEFGYSEHHMGFTGTLSLSRSTFVDMVTDIVDSLDRHGFSTIMLLVTHGGNFKPAEEIVTEHGPNVNAELMVAGDLDQHLALMNEGLDEAGIDHQEPTVHAGAVETAMMLEILPDKVDREAAEPGREGKLEPDEMLAAGFAQLTENGVIGDPRYATTEAGENILENLATEYAEQLRDTHKSGS